MPPPPPKRPRRRRGRVVVGLVAVAILLGVGGRFFGSGEGRPAPAEAGSTVAADREPAPAQPTGAEAVAPSVFQVPPPAEPGAESAAGETMAGGGDPVDGDRFASLVSLVRSRGEAGAFGEARLTLRELAALPLTGSQRAELAELERWVVARAATTAERVLEFARGGEVLAARRLAEAGLADAAGGFRRALGDAFAAAGLGALPSAPPELDRARWPLPAALARERVVVASIGADTVRGAVVDSRPDRVTLRVTGERGLTFPTVGLTACEPVGASSAEAAELGFGALQAGDPLLARLWLACAQSRLPAGGCPRAARLAELLR